MKSLLALFLLVGTAAPVRAANFPEGTFALKGPDGAECTLTFDGKVNFALARGGKEAVEGTYQVKKGEVGVTDVKGPRAQPKAEVRRYRRKLDGKRLTFSKIKDVSDGRARALTGAA